jgi:copper chaperone
MIRSIPFKVPDMACSACADKITKSIQAIATNAEVKADPQTKLVVVSTELNSEVSSEQIKAAIIASGYTVTD